MAKYIDNIDDCTALLFYQISTNVKEKSALCRQGKPTTRGAARAWEKLYNDYLKNFGLPENYRDYLELRIKANKAWVAVYVKGQKWQKLKAQLYEYQAHQVINDESKPKINDISILAARLSQHYGFGINPARESVRQFNSYILGMQQQ